MTAYDFILQMLAVAVVPIVIALVNQNRQMIQMKADLDEANKRYIELRTAFDKLQSDHEQLQKDYSDNLRLQAGMRNRF